MGIYGNVDAQEKAGNWKRMGMEDTGNADRKHWKELTGRKWEGKCWE